MRDTKPLGVRWTIGDVSANGFEALRLSIWGARRLFRDAADYVVCVNGISCGEARARTGALPAGVVWRDCGPPPEILRAHCTEEMAEGVAWKLCPLRLFPDRFELSLDNDCILWDLPEAIAGWLGQEADDCVIAADVTLAHGAFTDLTGIGRGRNLPRNTGIRGFPPGFDLGAALAAILRRRPVPLTSELDEQGLQVAALDLPKPARVVSVEDVSLCSPFWPKRPELGRCGAHFVGLNCRAMAWDYYGRPALEWVEENWRRHVPAMAARLGVKA